MALVEKHRLPYQEKYLEEIILMISDKFDIRVVIRDGETLTASIMTTGLALFGGFVGHLLLGKFGAVAGAAAGGACAVGIVAVSMRELWEEIKEKLTELFRMVYAYIAEFNFYDYENVVKYLIRNTDHKEKLAMMIIDKVAEIIGKKILSFPVSLLLEFFILIKDCIKFIYVHN